MCASLLVNSTLYALMVQGLLSVFLCYAEKNSFSKLLACCTILMDHAFIIEFHCKIKLIRNTTIETRLQN